MRSKWALLKAFPHLPPFGPDWFAPIKEVSWLGVLRESWIYINIGLDNTLSADIRRDEIELSAFYINPEMYLAIKDLEEGKSVSGRKFSITSKNSEFDKLLGMAMAGIVDPKDQNEEVRDRVKSMRDQMTAFEERDPRISNPNPPGYKGKDPPR